jgi:hypothetical protein
MKANSNLEFIRIDNRLVNLSNITTITLNEEYKHITFFLTNGGTFTINLLKNYGYKENSAKELFELISDKLTSDAISTDKFLSIKREVV